MAPAKKKASKKKKPAAKAKTKAKAPAKKAPAKQAKTAASKKNAAVKKAAAQVKAAIKKDLKKGSAIPSLDQEAMKSFGVIDSIRGQKLDASGEVICREVMCETLATTGGYCRLHYIQNWKMIKRKELILKEGKLNQYIEELVAKYPDKYIEAIRNDLASDKEFATVVNDLELDESIDDFDYDSESVDSLIEGIRRDVDDESEY